MFIRAGVKLDCSFSTGTGPKLTEIKSDLPPHAPHDFAHWSNKLSGIALQSPSFTKIVHSGDLSLQSSAKKDIPINNSDRFVS